MGSTTVGMIWGRRGLLRVLAGGLVGRFELIEEVDFRQRCNFGYIIFELMICDDENDFFIFNRSLLVTNLCSKSYRYKCKFYYSVGQQAIDFTRTLRELQLRHPFISTLLQGTQLFLVKPEQCRHVFIGNFPFTHPALADFEDWKDNTVTLLFRKRAEEASAENNAPKDHVINRRAKEKTIQQVLNELAIWGKIVEDSQGTHGKAPSLVATAKAMGMNKKTLDDYARCVRLGERLGFQVQLRSQEPISVLRRFVRESRESSALICQIQDPDQYWESTYFKASD